MTGAQWPQYRPVESPTVLHGDSPPKVRFATDSALEGEDLPPMIKRKSGAVTPRAPVVVQFLQGKGSTVLALSRTLCAGSADAALAAASLTAAARGALPGGRSGRRDGQFRSNKGMGGGSSRAGVPPLSAACAHTLPFDQVAGHRHQPPT